MFVTPLLSRRAMAFSVCLLLLVTGCKRRGQKVSVQVTDEDTATLASAISTADAKTAPQLLKGFYSVEGGGWRWTMGQFAVALRPPRNAAIRGAVLHFKFALPEAVTSKVGKVTLTASVNGIALKPETYTAPGDYDYSRDIDPKALAGEAVNVEFSMDKFLAAGAVEQRELGVIATSVGFEAK